MKNLRKTTLFASTFIFLSSCATTGGLVQPLEAQGKTLTAASMAVGGSAEAYVDASRMTLMRLAEAPTGVDSSPVGTFRTATSGTAADIEEGVGLYLICNPLKAGAAIQGQSNALNKLGQSLGKIAKDSPDTLVGLLGVMDKDYALTISDAQIKDADARALETICLQIVSDALNLGTPGNADLDRLQSINGHAVRDGVPGGDGETIGTERLVALIGALKTVATGFLKQVDQKQRRRALKKFYNDPKTMPTIEKHIGGLDHGVRVVSLGERVNSKARLLLAWNEYTAAFNSYGAVKTVKNKRALEKASIELRASAAGIDKLAQIDYAVHKSAPAQLLSFHTSELPQSGLTSQYFKTNDTISKTTDVEKLKPLNATKTKQEKKLGENLPVAKSNYIKYRSDITEIEGMETVSESYIVGKCKSVKTDDSTCFQTGLARALYTANQQTKAVAIGDLSKMTDEQKTAYWESVFATLDELNKLTANLAAFENDKESFVLLKDLTGSF